MSVSLISQIQIKFTVLKNKLPLLTSYFSYYFLLLTVTEKSEKNAFPYNNISIS